MYMGYIYKYIYIYNIYICCIHISNAAYISYKFRSINWLPTKVRVHQCINPITFKFVNNSCPIYLNEIFEFAPHSRIDKRNSFAKLKHLFC